MIDNQLDGGRLIVTYETMSGELAILRRRLVVDRPEIVGYAAGESHFEVIEAVFVTAEDASTAQFVLVGADASLSIADVLTARGIAFRFAAPRSHADASGQSRTAETVAPGRAGHARRTVHLQRRRTDRRRPVQHSRRRRMNNSVAVVPASPISPRNEIERHARWGAQETS